MMMFVMITMLTLTLLAMQKARQRGIRVIGFGVGSDVQPFGLSTITSWPSSETVFVANSSSHLPALRDPIVSATCNGQSYLVYSYTRL